MSEDIPEGEVEYIKLLEDVVSGYDGSTTHERRLTLNRLDYQTIQNIASQTDGVNGNGSRLKLMQKLAKAGYFLVPGGPKESDTVYRVDTETKEVQKIDI
jgi:hypothetical protein